MAEEAAAAVVVEMDAGGNGSADDDGFLEYLEIFKVLDGAHMWVIEDGRLMLDVRAMRP